MQKLKMFAPDHIRSREIQKSTIALDIQASPPLFIFSYILLLLLRTRYILLFSLILFSLLSPPCATQVRTVGHPAWQIHDFPLDRSKMRIISLELEFELDFVGRWEP